MDRQKAVLIWIAMAAIFALIAYLSGAAWYWAILIGILCVAAIVGTATGTMYWKQKKLISSAAKFNIDLKGGKINPADLRRMYFSGGQARKDALLIASQAMRCSVQEAEKQLSARITKEAAQREMAKYQQQPRFKGRPR
ncbi:magnesium transporter [Wielerella bovis]|uniref:magnesium transporter n=1 Tax=Wielerella bovis TaxID=2917790 RepID=UPI002019A14A|nr:magnesium transporter [Wielerella bovis]ULJ61710.1 magnesium transporter [Wielerella bovis]